MVLSLSCLLLGALTNLTASPLRGALTCRLLPMAGERTNREIFSLTTGKPLQTGDGSLRVMRTSSGALRWVRGDSAHASGFVSDFVALTNKSVQLTVSWDEQHVRVFADGYPVPHKRGYADNAGPLKEILSTPLCTFDATLTAACTRVSIGRDGVTDVRLWPEPLTPELPRDPLWRESWRNPPTPPPANRALRSAESGDLLAKAELVEDLRPVDLARSGDASRFRSAGVWSVGTCEGVEYLEAGKGLNDRFALRFRLDGRVPLWCFELTYPDDRARAMDLEIQNSRASSEWSMNNGIETGLEHSLTGRLAVKRYLYWRSEPYATAAENGDLALVAMTQTENEPAALARVRVYAIRDGRLPDARVRAAEPMEGRQRHFATWYEDPAAMYDFGTMRVGTDADFRLGLDRLAAYLRYSGQDMLVYPAIWYSGLIGDYYRPRPHPAHYLREICRRFDRDGLVFVPSINQQNYPSLTPKNLTREMLTDGSLHASPISILNTGLPNQGGWHHTPPNFNVSHPEVRRVVLDEVRQICEECREHASFGGIAIDLFNAHNATWWGGLAAGYNDYSIAAFERASGIRVPVDRANPLRGKAYARWLATHAREKWIAWRCDVLTSLYREIAEMLRACRSDLILYVRCSIPWRNQLARRSDLFEEEVADRLLREAGVDCRALGRLANVSVVRMSMPAYWHDELQRLKVPHETRERIRDLPESVGFQRLTETSSYPFACFHDSYYENPVGAAKKAGRHAGDGRLSGDWLQERGGRVTSFSASGREALRPYATALKFGDVLAFGRGGYLIGTLGDEEVVLPFVRAFRALPARRFADLADFSHPDVRVRTATTPSAIWYYAVNTSAKATTVQLTFPKGTVDAVSGSPIHAPLTLAPYELRSFRRSLSK